MRRTQPWFIGAALRAIAQHVNKMTQDFSAVDVAGWGDAFGGKPGLARLAMDRLKAGGLVEAVERPHSLPRPVINLEPRWRLTAKGLGTCRAVLQALPGAAPPNAEAMSTRLWALLRARRTLTSDEAASTLIDAGSRDFSKAQHQINSYMRAWARLVPDVVQVSARRVEGCKRYVMVKDGGIHPPPTKASGIVPQPVPKAHKAPGQVADPKAPRA